MKVIGTSANGAPLSPCAQIGNTVQQNSIRYTVHSCKLAGDDIIYTLDQLDQNPDHTRMSIEVSARELHGDIHYNRKITSTSWSLADRTHHLPTTTATPSRVAKGKSPLHATTIPGKYDYT